MKRFISIFIAILLTGSILQLHSMEDKTHQKPLSPYALTMIKPFTKNACIILLNDNSIIHVPLEQIKPFKTLSNAIKFNKSPVVDLRSYPELASQKELQLLLNCAGPHGKKTISSLSKDNAKKMLLLADMFQAEDFVLHQLSDRVLPTLEQEEFNNLFHGMQRSLKNILLAKKHGYSVELPKQNNSSSLPLHEMKLDSLDGIEQLKSKSIKILDISNNNLKNLQLKKIVNVFPNIAIINANHNKISNLTKDDLEAIFEGLILHLEHNQINTIEVGDGINAYNAHINLKNNPLTSTALGNLYNSVKPSTTAKLKNNLKKMLAKLKGIGANHIDSFLYAATMIMLTGRPHALSTSLWYQCIILTMIPILPNLIYGLDPIAITQQLIKFIGPHIPITAVKFLILTVIPTNIYLPGSISEQINDQKAFELLAAVSSDWYWHRWERPKGLSGNYKLLDLHDANSIQNLIAYMRPLLDPVCTAKLVLERYPDVPSKDIKILLSPERVKKMLENFVPYCTSSNILKELLFKYVDFNTHVLPKVPYPYNILIGLLGITAGLAIKYTKSPIINAFNASKIIEVDKNINYIGLKKKEGAYNTPPSNIENLD